MTHTLGFILTLPPLLLLLCFASSSQDKGLYRTPGTNAGRGRTTLPGRGKTCRTPFATAVIAAAHQSGAYHGRTRRSTLLCLMNFLQWTSA